jgi:hypothetical protein
MRVLRAGGAFYRNPFPDACLRGVCEAKMSVGGTLTAGELACGLSACDRRPGTGSLLAP